MKKDWYIDFVCQKAIELGKEFFLDTGEGNDFCDNKTQWYIEDLSGWLINPHEKEKFILARRNNTVYDEFSDEYVFVRWSKNSNQEIKITFEHY